MHYAQRLPTPLSTRTIAAPIVALVLGAAAATGVNALLDDGTDGVPPAATKVIVAEPPAQPGEGVSAKDEAATATAIGR
jgi:hypothetical protein